MISWTTRITIILTCGIIVWLLMGCGITDDEPDVAEVQNKPLEELYDDALAMMAEKEYKGAIEAFEEVERQYPYSEWATRAQVMAGYAAYRANEFEESAVILERFTKLHPNHESTPYAYYLIAMGYYDQISDVGRDQKMTEEARRSLREVVTRFPNTEFARDAKLKLDLTEDHLAGKEMEIGRWYLKQQEYLAAINRFKRVVELYQTTSHTPEALHRLVEAYLHLGVMDEAKKYAAVLGTNFPGSDWYRYSFAMMNGEVDPEKDERFVNELLPDWEIL